MTPLEINILLHYYTSPIPFENITQPAVDEAINMFLEKKILRHHFDEYDEPSVNVYEVTKRGKALVKLLIQTEFPREVYIDKDGNIIE